MTCEGSISLIVLGNNISNLGVCAFRLLFRRPGRRKRGPKELDSQKKRVQNAPMTAATEKWGFFLFLSLLL